MSVVPAHRRRFLAPRLLGGTYTNSFGATFEGAVVTSHYAWI